MAENFKPVRVYHKNGASFLCNTQRLLDIYIKAGWSKTPIKKPDSAESEKE